MGTVKDLTATLLREIRDEMRRTREDLGSRIDATNGRLDEANARLGALEGAVRDLAGQQTLPGRYVKNVMKRQQSDVASLQRRVDALESWRGSP